MRINEIRNGVKYRMDEQFQNLTIFDMIDCQIGKILKFCLFLNMENFILIWKILKISDLKHSKDFQLGKFEKFAIWQIPKTLN